METTTPESGTPVTSAPSVQSMPTPAPKRRMHPAVIGAVVVGALAVGYLAYAYFTESGPFAPAEEPMASVSPSPSVSASPTSDPMAGWETYTSVDLGFEVKLPPSWNPYRATLESTSVWSGVWFSTPCVVNGQTDWLGHFIIGRSRIADYENWKAQSMKDGSPLPTEITRDATYVYTYNHSQDGCSGPWEIPEADWMKIIATFKLTR